MSPRPTVGETVAFYGAAVHDVYMAVAGSVPVHGFCKVEYEFGLSAWVGVALYSTAFCGGQFHIDVVAVKVDSVISCFAVFFFMAEHGVYAKRCFCLP